MNAISTFFSTNDQTSVKGGLMKSLLSLFSKEVKEVPRSAQIVTVNHNAVARSIPVGAEDDVVTILYSKESLDSLFGLSFFSFLYGDRVNAVEYDSVTANKEGFKASTTTIILGVQVSESDLVHISANSKSVSIFGYRGSYEWLYDYNVLSNVILLKQENAYISGSKDFGILDNSVAMMMKNMFHNSNVWVDWKQNVHAMDVAHYTSLYQNMADVGMYKSKIEIQKIEGEDSKTTIRNASAATMFDLRNKLESVLLDHTKKIYEVQAIDNEGDYVVYKNRLLAHIDRTRTKRAFKTKTSVLTGTIIPAIGFSVTDIVSLASSNTFTTICVEDLGDSEVYHVYSKNTATAHAIVSALMQGTGWASSQELKTSRMWINGPIVCVSKLKEVK